MNKLGRKPWVTPHASRPEFGQKRCLFILRNAQIPFCVTGYASRNQPRGAIETLKYSSLPTLLPDAGAGQLPAALEGADVG